MQNECVSVMAVFEAVSRYGEVSRSELSDITGFSLVTVGKAVEQLCRCGLMIERKQSKAAVGRRSSVCSLPKECGFILFDMSHNKPYVRICDLRLESLLEYTEEDRSTGEMWLGAFEKFTEILGSELLGIGVIAPEGKNREIADIFSVEMGNTPDLVVDDIKAYAAANSLRTDAAGQAVIVRLFKDGRADGAITYNGRLHSGAHGCAGGFSRIVKSKESLAECILNTCAVLDPEVIHIACENEADLNIKEALTERISELYGTDEYTPRIITEPIADCNTALDGAAMLLRSQHIMMKLSKNS